MRKYLILLLAAVTTATHAFPHGNADALILVKGGKFLNTKSNCHGKSTAVADFRIGKHEVTQKEWTEVMGNNPSEFKGDNLPVENVSWYDCIEYCNRRSEKEGLKPYYHIDKNIKDPNNRTDVDDLKWTVTINAGADGYRLPSETEWEYAAGGGQLSKSYTYSGSDDLDKVAWFWQNSGDVKLTGLWNWPAIRNNNSKTKPVGSKEPNELGLYDMSGNVREWCWDWYGELDDKGNPATGSSSETGRSWRGGGWIGGEFCCEPAFRANFEASGRGPDQGLRICRDHKADQKPSTASR